MRALVLVEAIVCFVPAALLLSLAFFLVPVQLVVLLGEPLSAEGPTLLLSSVVAGTIGLVTLVYVLTKLFRNEPLSRPFPVLAAIAVALLPLVRLMWDSGFGWNILMGLPILASAHILYLSWPLMLRPRERFPRPKDPNDLLRVAVLAIIATGILVRPVAPGLSADELRQARALWMSAKTHSYTYELWPAGYLPVKVLDRPHRVEVRNGKVTSAAYLTEESSALLLESAWTMEEIFDQLIRSELQRSRVRARFDARKSYVQRAFIETEDREWDWDIEIREFRPL